MRIEIFQVDAFTEEPFRGNPAAVCLLPGARDSSWMQWIAREMNLPETAFLISREEGFDLRWFTPEVEVELCGHATLGSAHCCFGPCWAKKLGKGEMLAYQASARGGWLRVRLEGVGYSSGAVP